QAEGVLSSLEVPRRDEVHDEWSVTAQHGSGGAVGAPMRRRTGRSLPDPCPAAPNRSGDGAPAPVHGSLGTRSYSRARTAPSRGTAGGGGGRWVRAGRWK